MSDNNSLPYEIIAAPFTVWYAPVGTAFPDVEFTPGAPWAKVGSSGDLNYTDDGVTISHSQEMELFRALGDAGSRKAFRISEDLLIKLMLADLTLEQYAHALNSNSITTVPAMSNAGYKKIGLSRGFSVATVALLVRGPSPYGADWTMQFEVPRAAQTGNPEVVMRKGEPAALALEWTALVDPDAASEDERFGRILAQHADPGT
jgi:hypothetical protein